MLTTDLDVDQLVQWLQLKNTPETIRTRVYWIQRLIRWASESGTTVWELNARDVNQWLLDCGLAPNTRRSALSSARALYRWGLMTHQVSADPTAQIPTIKVPRAAPRPAPSEAIERGLQRATSRRDVLMMLLANYGGLRCAEIASLHSHDFHDRVLWITGKGGHTRIVPAHSLLAELLDLFPRGYYFPSEKNATGHYRPASISRRIRTLMDPGWSAHTLRHRFATDFYAHTPDLLALKDLLGHASVATTQIYTATDPRRLEAGVFALPELRGARAATSALAGVE